MTMTMIEYEYDYEYICGALSRYPYKVGDHKSLSKVTPKTGVTLDKVRQTIYQNILFGWS